MNRAFYDNETITASQTEKYLTFILDDQFYAIPIANVIEIIAMQETTKMPDFPDYVKGVINLRGTIIPLIDVRLRFRKPEREYDARTSVIVVSVNDVQVGFIVDMVDEVKDIDNSDIADPPKMSGDMQNRYIIGIGKVEGKIVLLLDSNKVLNEKEIESIAQAL
ncbi:MAG TPA: chemotaxis protein CheW [Oscillospiraceae bacterium]|nr:chemotaxis protein CheW [Oscillospiraceae bacterium]